MRKTMLFALVCLFLLALAPAEATWTCNIQPRSCSMGITCESQCNWAYCEWVNTIEWSCSHFPCTFEAAQTSCLQALDEWDACLATCDDGDGTGIEV